MVFLLQPDLKPFFTRKLALGPVLACALCLGLFAYICSLFYLPGKGFTYLIEFGEREHARYLPQLQAVNHYELKDSPGYDAQYYAQIAMQPHLADPALQGALDSVPYRARRILLAWTAYALAGGNSLWALHIFSVQNLFCWYALAVLLWRWLPPVGWGNFFRWACILFCFGLACSVRGSLTDGPSLLLIGCAAALVEAEKLWLAALVLGISALARETNLLAGLMLFPVVPRWSALSQRAEQTRNSDAASGQRPSALGATRSTAWTQIFGLGALAVAPLIIWLAILHFWLRTPVAGTALTPLDLGARNWAWPFAGYFGRWRETFTDLGVHGFDWVGRGELLVPVALTAQWLYLVLRPRWSEVWWRIAAPYAVLAVFLGHAVWEGYPGAAARVILPLTAAFCLLVPLRRWWILWFIAGNVSLIVSIDILNPPGRESSVVTGPRPLRIVAATGAVVDTRFDDHWFEPEKSWLEYWRWSGGDAGLTFFNPHPYALQADISFGLRANDGRIVGVTTPGRTLWLGRLEKGKLRDVTIRNFPLPPGDTHWQFETDTPPIPPSPLDKRPLAFSLRNLRVELRTLQSLPAAAGKAAR
jgi:hypothetical protein